jgi:hypothetical protein
MTTTINKTVKMLHQALGKVNQTLGKVQQRQNVITAERETREKLIAQLAEGNASTANNKTVADNETENEPNGKTRFKTSPEFMAILENMSKESKEEDGTWTVTELMEKSDKAGLRPEGMDDNSFKRKLFSQVYNRVDNSIIKKSAGYGHNEARYANRKKPSNRKG